jgi:glycosyltransferase involved in cell wall biosynthesis
VLSDEWYEKLSQRLPDIEFTVIKNGVPVPLAIAKPQGKDTVKVLFLGNLSKRKGVWDLIEAMATVPTSVQLILAGGEDEANIGEKLNEKIQTLGLEKNVTWLGPVYGEEKAQLLSQADIFVLPSYAEGLPISLLEAMCAGLPVIATPVGGIPTVVAQNKQGLLVEAGNVRELSEALQTLASNPQLRTQLGAASRQTCMDQYSIESVVEKYMEMYSKILKN